MSVDDDDDEEEDEDDDEDTTSSFTGSVALLVSASVSMV